MTQRIREAERELRYEEYAGREGDIVTGTVQQGDSRYTLLSLGPVEALLPQAEQVLHERPEANSRLKAYIVEVRRTSKGPQIVVSRTTSGLILELQAEVPEIADGRVEIKAAPASPATAPRCGVSTTNVERSGRASGPGRPVRQVATSCGARRSTSSPSPTTPTSSWPRPCHRPRSRRCASTRPPAWPR